ncbi:MAG: LacI family DNA-binding transcriptional regulator [Thermomicrobiales bacterium]|nr:LacI family DNA-binding transcriptional regulator [Thermomicrobiales bacterium]
MSFASSTTRKRPTQADVARLAGVSQAIVSYVLNNRHAEVAEETRLRVLAAIDELGYVPHRAARSLRTSRTMTIASIIADIANPFYPALERGVQRLAEARGYDLLVSNTDGVFEKEERALRGLLRGHADGAVMVPFFKHRELIRGVVESGVSISLVSTPDPELMEIGVDFVRVDTERGARLAVDYLVRQGHTRIGVIAGIAGTPPSDDRVLGYRKALAAHDLPADDLLIRRGDFQEAGGYAAMKELLTVEPLPTAVFSVNDLMAFGALIALRERGLRVPDDIAIVGFDDIPAARIVHPPLTTVTQFTEELGQLAAEFLLSRLAGDAPAEGRRLDHRVELIVRSSA